MSNISRAKLLNISTVLASLIALVFAIVGMVWNWMLPVALVALACAFVSGFLCVKVTLIAETKHRWALQKRVADMENVVADVELHGASHISRTQRPTESAQGPGLELSTPETYIALASLHDKIHALRVRIDADG